MAACHRVTGTAAATAQQTTPQQQAVLQQGQLLQTSTTTATVKHRTCTLDLLIHWTRSSARSTLDQMLLLLVVVLAAALQQWLRSSGCWQWAQQVLVLMQRWVQLVLVVGLLHMHSR
jgi:hypothetical protein